MRLTWHDPDYATGYDPARTEHVRVKRLGRGQWEITTMHVGEMRIVAQHHDTTKQGIMAWVRQRFRRE